ATLLSRNLMLLDVDNTSLAGARIWIQTVYDRTEDLWVNVSGAPLSFTYNRTTGVLMIVGIASVQDYQRVLGSATYNNLEDEPTFTTRIIKFVVTDGL